MLVTINRTLSCCFGVVRTWCVLAVVLGILSAVGAVPVRADKPLTHSDCKALQADKADAVQQGLARDIARGPEWAKTNLGADRLREILRLIEIEELLTFRCEKVFEIASKEKQLKDREAARRLGIKIPPLPGKNPNRDGSQRATTNTTP